MTSMETEYLTGLDGTYSQIRGQGCRRDKRNWGGGWGRGKVSIGTMHSVNPPTVGHPSLLFLHKGEGSTFPKLMKMGKGGI